ncbi:MAG: hypothetical protein JNJ83_00010 [Verrucomicrobiaceae bacterium]|nr:hypothetical protein [Verrucomicrobiaceae bacterium]
MKNRTLSIFCCLQFFGIGASAQLSPEAERALQAAYSGDSAALLDTVKTISRAAFPTEGHRTIAMIQAYAASENVEHLAEARRIAERYIAESTTDWIRDFVRIQLSTVLSLEGNRKAGGLLAEQALSDTDFESLPFDEDPFLRFIARRVGISPAQIPTYLKDNLHFQVGSYYLNRSVSEGGADTQNAVKHFGSIAARELRESAMSDQRLKGIDLNGLERSGSSRALPQERAGNRRSPTTSLEVPNESPSRSLVSPSKPLTEKPMTPAPSEKPTLSTHWSIIVVLIVAAIGLLWLLLKKRN